MSAFKTLWDALGDLANRLDRHATVVRADAVIEDTRGLEKRHGDVPAALRRIKTFAESLKG